MKMHGRRANGTVGVLSADEIKAWIIAKAYGVRTPPQVYVGNAGQCAGGFLSHNGSSDGGGTDYTHNNRTVFHISHGKKKKNSNSCTIFFVRAEEGSDTGKIVAVGCHVGPSAYAIDWVDPHWTNSPLREGHDISL